MFGFTDHRSAGERRVDVAFTDARTNLQSRVDDLERFRGDLDELVAVAGVPFARLSQVHGDRVHVVTDEPPAEPGVPVPEGDALVTTRVGTGLMIRVADCVPLVLADADAGVIGAVHSGRPGLALNVAGRTVDVMREHGARDLTAWIGPHVCGGCYEVPEAMRDEVAALVPAAYARTTWGTPALDIGAGLAAQLDAAGVEVTTVGGCTREDPRLHSYRRDGAAAGRFAGLVWLT